MINLWQLLKGINLDKYYTRVYAIQKKLEIDKLFYPNDKEKIKYIFSHIKDSILNMIYSDVFNMGKKLTLKPFFFKKSRIT